MSRRALIDVALGRAPADLVVTNGRVVNVLTQEIYEAGIAIKGDRIAAVGDIEYTVGDETATLDADGRYMTPGLIDGHLHMYHSYLGVNAFTEVMLSHGVTAWADGFYGQGIVGGAEAVRFFKSAFDEVPLRLIFLVPTLAYLQNRELGLEPARGISAEEMREMLDWDGCLGLEEPPFLPIVDKWEEFLDLFEATLAQRKVITGHAAGIDWRQTQAYVAMGTSTDHEATGTAEALAKARAGLRLMMRQASGAVDVPAVVKTFTEHRIDPRVLAFCADVASPEKLVAQGSVDENIRVAIANGVPPAIAVQMATLNVAELFGLQNELGVLAPGRYADLLLVDDLVEFSIGQVVVGAQVVCRDGSFVADLQPVEYPESFRDTVRLERPLTPEELSATSAHDGPVRVRAIGVTDGSLVTEELEVELRARSGVIQPDLAADVLPLAMVDRFGKGGRRIGLGFVTGFGLKRGAIASTVNAVCENLVAVGTNPTDMARAMNHLSKIGGGKIVVVDGEIVALVELSLLGLLSEDSLTDVTGKFEQAFAEIADLGCELANPFSQLEFSFACGEIGDIKLSDEGLVRVHPPEKVELAIAS
jgi:adenine deaminase